jgi:hypothetical protein
MSCGGMKSWASGLPARRLIDWTLAEAAVRAGLRDVALSIAHERLGTRPEKRAEPSIPAPSGRDRRLTRKRG